MSVNYRTFVLALQDCVTETENVLICQKIDQLFDENQSNPFVVTELLQELLILNTLSYSVENHKFFIIAQASKNGLIRISTTTLLNIFSTYDKSYLLLHTNTIQKSLTNPFSNSLNTLCALRTLKLYINQSTYPTYLNCCLGILNKAPQRPSNESSVLRQTLGTLPLFLPYLTPQQQTYLYHETIKLLQLKNSVVLEAVVAVLTHFSNMTTVNMLDCIELLLTLLSKLLRCKPIGQIQNVSYPFLISNILRLLYNFPSLPKGYELMKDIVERFAHQLTNGITFTILFSCLKCIQKHFPLNMPQLEIFALNTLLASNNSLFHRAYLKIISLSSQYIEHEQPQILKLYLGNDPLTSLEAFKLLLPQSMPIVQLPQNLSTLNEYTKSKFSEASIHFIDKFQQPLNLDSIISILNCFPSKALLNHVADFPLKESPHLISPSNSISQMYCTIHNIKIPFSSEQTTLLLLTLKSESKSSLPLTISSNTISLEMKQRLHEYKSLQTDPS
ncbi:hypothetical protein EDI_124770 [Entamoeba dispar SAW760]|uniref:Uncharacterized protein n=1 Tax=Entamoeba dispar (strain ATCC PRA-260 / SAW760) TaxID=370354 RepID=B0ENY2_ENTDS|nr:uncharacterized protein EDI_124770 [Entamoeba dispar SAW760]EDR23764.1 hypothetical protein EDI_124770 [Entamoeba dispar SAW760]|eukprot:EDR23764.1 hypothetical protein EDI_124770 [Entamoeba dispar SAW760]